MTIKTPARFSRAINYRVVCLGLGAATLSAAVGRASAAWPNRPMTVVVPYAPGGNTDMMARLSSQCLASKLDQSFVIENRTGGDGAVGAIGVSKARPDDYTLLFGASTIVPRLNQLAILPFGTTRQEFEKTMQSRLINRESMKAAALPLMEQTWASPSPYSATHCQRVCRPGLQIAKIASITALPGAERHA